MCQLKGFTLKTAGLQSLGKRAPTFIPVPNAKKLKLAVKEASASSVESTCEQTTESTNFENSEINNTSTTQNCEQTTQNSTATSLPQRKSGLSLIQAARAGNLEVVKELIEAGEDINQAVMGCTALHYAAFYNRKDIVEYLISMEAELNVKNSSGFTPLAWAVDRGYADIAWMLLEATADPAIGDSKGNTPLHKATIAKNLQMVETLLAINTDEDEWCKVNATTSDGCTAAYFAAFQGSDDILRVLIDFGANINLASSKNISPLHRAVSGNRVETVKFLLEHGANVNHADDAGRTALHLAVAVNNAEIVKLLIEHKAKLALDSRSKTALQLAEIKKATLIVELLTEYAASLAE